jgi:hypothetical protein
MGQKASGILERKLVETGFENIRVSEEGQSFFVSFENNIYRWNVRAIATALDTLAANTDPGSKIHLVQLRYDIPQIVTSVGAGDWLQFRSDTSVTANMDTSLQISYDTRKSWNKVKKNRPLTPNDFRFDLVFYPQLFIANLTFEKIYEVQFNIAPALEVSLWKGMLLTAQVILPIYSDCKVYGEASKKVRPGFLVISQDFRLPGPLFGKVSVGNFNYERYGLDLNLNYPFSNPRWYLGLNAGLTGYSVFTADEGWDLGPMERFTLHVSGGYFLPRYNLRFELSGGRYIRGDYGGRFDLSRMFGETTIGLYASFTTLTDFESGQPNAGFHVAIPFPPGKRLKRRRFRVDLPGYFDWEYNGATEFYYGRYYEVRPNENRTEHYFNPLYIKNELLKNRHYR